MVYDPNDFPGLPPPPRAANLPPDNGATRYTFRFNAEIDKRLVRAFIRGRGCRMSHAEYEKRVAKIAFSAPMRTFVRKVIDGIPARLSKSAAAFVS